jgi:hypothetical protein
MTACRVCTAQFEPRRPLQAVCSPICAVRHVRADRKAKRAETKARREAAKPRSKWLAEAQQAFNAWIRARDAGKGCISCGTHNGKANAGHYLSTGARPELRFNEANVALQCERCNTYLHGNLIAYRINLIERIGSGVVDWLEGPHQPAKWTIDELRAIRDDYRRRLKEMA